MAFHFTIDLGDGATALPYGPFRDAAQVSHPAQVLDLWTDDELAEIGVVRETYTEVPTEVSAMQAQLALASAGLLDDVEAAVAASPAEVRIYWSKAPTLHRDHPVLEAMRTALGWSTSQVDNLFIAAAAVT
jgi:hypothetical protein